MSHSPIKQILVIRNDLNVKNAGKLIAQGAHASLGSIFPRETSQLFPQADGSVLFQARLTPEQAFWFTDLSTKVAVIADDEEHLLLIHRQAVAAGLPCVLIEDAGFTEFAKPTLTAVGIGPAPSAQLDPITRSLRLFR